MPPENDIDNAAQIVIDRYGPGAEAAAQRRSLRLSQDGQSNAAAIWQRICAAIARLQPSGESRARRQDQAAVKHDRAEANGS